MGNSPSSFKTARAGLTAGDASSLSEEVWSDLWGSDGSQPPLGPGDMLNFLTDATLRKLRAERPMNLAALIARAVATHGRPRRRPRPRRRRTPARDCGQRPRATAANDRDDRPTDRPTREVPSESVRFRVILHGRSNAWYT